MGAASPTPPPAPRAALAAAIGSVAQYISVYSLLSVVMGAQGAVLTFVHSMGNPQWDTVCGSVLMGLAVLAAVAHTYLNSLTIGIPAGVYHDLQVVDSVLVTLLGGSGIVIQYVSSVSPTLTPLLATLLQGLALLASLFAALFKATSATKAAA